MNSIIQMFTDNAKSQMMFDVNFDEFFLSLDNPRI